ncbi:MAG: ATPase, T2SS/T4P/T4SS family, partial [Acidobacteria bacterium]|nr:ATPase, T2SS/T4P/T4SS family [Acidobacteriota bacterium]MDW7985079.1 ATPase, T2SS/T4P/T4SS family [Acidobacteriota bacterium]
MQVTFLVYECLAEWRPAAPVECWICGHATPLVVEGVPLCLGCLLATRGLRTGRPPGPASVYMYSSITGEALSDAPIGHAVALRQAELLSPTARPVCLYEVERMALTREFGMPDVARLLKLPSWSGRPTSPLPAAVRRFWPLERARSTGIVPVEAVFQGSGRIHLALAGLPAEGDLLDLLSASLAHVAELAVQMTALDPQQEREALLTCLYTEGLSRRIALPADRTSPPADEVPPWDARAFSIDPQAIQPTVRSGAESVRVLILEAYRQGASDIHVEPYPMENAWGTRIRFRVDGLLQDVLRVREPVWRAICQALKHLCRMTAGVVLEPRDGSFTVDLEGTPIHLRVNIIPAGPEPGGESAVIRILQQDMLRYPWTDLGLMGPAWEALEAALREPWGMVIIAGPTGSGKSTTFHKLVQRLPG